jgi:DtxR family transcriptional regulator, Mn-dependent transcriptional regulator
MDTYDGLELSPRKVEYLKFIAGQGCDVKTTDLSTHFAVDPSTITRAIGELTTVGLISHVRYGDISLTEDGRMYAEFLFRRHRILGLVLRHYGFSADEACCEVTRFESMVSRDAVDRICRSMGHPIRGICGDITHESCTGEESNKSPEVS